MVDNVAVGPVQNSLQYERVKGFLEIKTTGARVATGADFLASETGKGYFVKPTVIDRPSDTSRIVVEEPFGT